MKKTALEKVLEDENDELAFEPNTPSIGACQPTTAVDGDPYELLFSHDDFNDDDDFDDESDESLFTDEGDD